jgi:LuxR family maltose regulon positive regulatory protein
MRTPVETVLGRDGVGLAECAICESKFEKGQNVSERLLTLMARLGEIQAQGTPDIEFAVLGLLARVQVSQGRADAALESIASLRTKFEGAGETRFLGNIDALLCRIRLRLDGEEAGQAWLESSAPKNEARLWAMWRYQYLTRAMAQLATGETLEPQLLLSRLLSYCETCGRVMDGLHIRILMALCRERQGDAVWKDELCIALDTCLSYRFVWPVAQYGAAILPLLRECGWGKDPAFLDALSAAARAQAVFYPRFLQPAAPMPEPLSAAESQVLRLVCRGLSNQEIGEILDIKVPTVKTHVSHILQKLGVKSRGEARDRAEKLHLL